MFSPVFAEVSIKIALISSAYNLPSSYETCAQKNNQYDKAVEET